LHQEKREKDLENMSLGETVLRFFEFYGVKNDWGKKKIIMHDGGHIADKNQSDGQGFSLLSP